MEDNWRKFKPCFILYLEATGASKKGRYSAGSLVFQVADTESLHLFNHFHLTQPEVANYETIIKKFEEHCTALHSTWSQTQNKPDLLQAA